MQSDACFWASATPRLHKILKQATPNYQIEESGENLLLSKTLLFSNVTVAALEHRMFLVRTFKSSTHNPDNGGLT